jgi:hypothetical protein
MEALLGFHVDIWDYATFAAIFVIVAAGLVVVPYSFWVFPAGSPLPASIPRPAQSISWVGLASSPSSPGFRL